MKKRKKTWNNRRNTILAAAANCIFIQRSSRETSKFKAFNHRRDRYFKAPPAL